MKKIPTLFTRKFENHKVVGITPEVTEGTAQLYDVLPSVFQPDFSKTSSKNKK